MALRRAWWGLLKGLSRGAGLAIVAGCFKAMLYAHHVWLQLARVTDEGGISVTLRQLHLGDPALPHDAAGIGTHVGRNGIHLALLEVWGKVLAVV